MPKETFFPDTKEPHVHVHKGGATFTDARHKHKALANNAGAMKNNVKAVYDDLKGGNAREKSIAEYIKKTWM